MYICKFVSFDSYLNSLEFSGLLVQIVLCYVIIYLFHLFWNMHVTILFSGYALRPRKYMASIILRSTYKVCRKVPYISGVTRLVAGPGRTVCCRSLWLRWISKTIRSKYLRLTPRRRRRRRRAIVWRPNGRQRGWERRDFVARDMFVLLL